IPLLMEDSTDHVNGDGSHGPPVEGVNVADHVIHLAVDLGFGADHDADFFGSGESLRGDGFDGGGGGVVQGLHAEREVLAEGFEAVGKHGGAEVDRVADAAKDHHEHAEPDVEYRVGDTELVGYRKENRATVILQ